MGKSVVRRSSICPNLNSFWTDLLRLRNHGYWRREHSASSLASILKEVSAAFQTFPKTLFSFTSKSAKHSYPKISIPSLYLHASGSALELPTLVSMFLDVFKELEPCLQWLWKLPQVWPHTSHRVKLALSVLLGIGAMRKINNLLSQAALNNFTSDSYDWRKEIVLVTGGSGGLGDLLVRKLTKRCIKVISLDIMPPKTPLRQLTSSTLSSYDHIRLNALLQLQMHTSTRWRSHPPRALNRWHGRSDLSMVILQF